MRPLIDSMFNVRSQPTFQSSIPSQPVASAPPKKVGLVDSVHSLSDLESIIRSEKAVVVFFTSAECPPCTTIAPKFTELVETYKSFPKGSWRDLLATTFSVALHAIQVDISRSHAIASRYQITATPTFLIFCRGVKVREFGIMMN